MGAYLCAGQMLGYGLCKPGTHASTFPIFLQSFSLYNQALVALLDFVDHLSLRSGSCPRILRTSNIYISFHTIQMKVERNAEAFPF